ncbi:MAG: M48 family metallopeptidase [Ferruginibacter sp.]
MQQNQIKISANFKKMAAKAMLSIALFLFVYLLLFVTVMGITILCGWLGLMLIIFKPAFITIMVGVGIMSIGVLVMIFLLKFMFKKHTTDRSHLTELTREQEPQLFEYLADIVGKVKTNFPKKVYLSAEVNASVFYDSNFWSMFFPVKKNLQIGMGLVNSVSAVEFKAILAHEFGHFSQKSMKVGSYVYNVNRVIYNLLYDNESFQSLAQQWANASGYFSFFVRIAVAMVQGIQWILRKVYAVVNLNYMGLSREMEFHADAVAASVTGSAPMITALLRLDLSDNSYNTVLNYYGDKIEAAVKTNNIYPQQYLVMNFLAKESKLAVENHLPQVSVQYLNKYNKSKLVIKDQWASHPSTIDRVRELQNINNETTDSDNRLASALFTDIDTLQLKMTENLFAGIDYGGKESFANAEQFITEFTNNYRTNSFDEKYNGYYDNKNPVVISAGLAISNSPDYTGKDMSSFFNNENVDLVYTTIALENDLVLLNQVAKKEYQIKTFDYDGEKYASADSTELIPKLEKELAGLKENIGQRDLDIYEYFGWLAVKRGKEKELTDCYQSYLSIDQEYPVKMGFATRMIEATQFLHVTNSYEVIESSLAALKEVEKEFKQEISKLLKEQLYEPAITRAINDNFNAYLLKNWRYFTRPEYDNDSLKIMFTAMSDFQLVMSETFLNRKRVLLNYQVDLEDHKFH